MVDLEQEYQLLMLGVIKQINDKLYNGDLSSQEAEKLTKLVEYRAIFSVIAPEDRCPYGHDYACGWSHSMGYHCS